jgi:uncharacterized protein involved in exopolysaccharide biosynthesis
MKTEPALARLPYAEPEIRLDSLVRPYLRRWLTVTACVLLSCGAAFAMVVLPQRQYRSQVVMAAVPNARAASLAGGLSSLFAGGQLGGVQSTPYFITKLLLLRSVLREVAELPAGDGSGRTVIERVLDRPKATMRAGDVDRGMRGMLGTEIDKQTGLVTFTVTHRDSALTRYVSERVVAAASRTYVRVLHSQASDQREAGQAKADSARRQLRTAEARLQDFATTHRVFAPYSNAAVERQRLERDVTNAQAAYAEAVEDRQKTVARELEDSPAVVVVDPIPPELTAEPRQGVLKMALGVGLGLMLATLILVVRGDFRTRPAEERVSARAAA